MSSWSHQCFWGKSCGQWKMQHFFLFWKPILVYLSFYLPALEPSGLSNCRPLATSSSWVPLLSLPTSSSSVTLQGLRELEARSAALCCTAWVQFCQPAYFVHWSCLLLSSPSALTSAYPTRPSQSVHVQCSWSSCPTTILSDASVRGLAPLSISDTVASLIFLNTACCSQGLPNPPSCPREPEFNFPSLSLFLSLPFLVSFLFPPFVFLSFYLWILGMNPAYWTWPLSHSWDQPELLSLPFKLFIIQSCLPLQMHLCISFQMCCLLAVLCIWFHSLHTVVSRSASESCLLALLKALLLFTTSWFVWHSIR